MHQVYPVHSRQKDKKWRRRKKKPNFNTQLFPVLKIPVPYEVYAEWSNITARSEHCNNMRCEYICDKIRVKEFM